MKVFDGSSTKSNAQEAISEATRHWDYSFSPDMLFVFHSTVQSPQAVATVLSERFPNAKIVGCTSAGEWLANTHKNGALILLAMSTPEIQWSVAKLEGMDVFSKEDISQVCANLLTPLNIKVGDLNADKHFCLSFFDAMSKQEEGIIAAMATELGGIPLLGGSAGDDLKLEKTYVIANGIAYQNTAVFVLAESNIPFRTIKHQHFTEGEKDVVITKADIKKRVVYTLNGMPAAQCYAELLGLEVQDLNAQVFSDNPLMYSYGGEDYIRAIGCVGENNALTFWCAIEEGMVLSLCKHQDMLLTYGELMKQLKQSMGKISILFIFNCIYRALEGKEADINYAMAEKHALIAQYVFGFDTYGEQWQGLHMNQTLVALVLGEENE